MPEKNIVRLMRRLILSSYSLVDQYRYALDADAQQLQRWLVKAEEWNEKVQNVSGRIAYLQASEVEMLHEAKHFHTPVYIALSEQANVIFASWFQAQAKLSGGEPEPKKRGLRG